MTENPFEIHFTLVGAYEEQHYKILLPDPIEAIKHAMEGRDLSRIDLEPYIGSSRRASDVLNRKRPLTLRMMRVEERACSKAKQLSPFLRTLDRIN